MKFKNTLFLGLLTALVGFGLYYYEFIYKIQKQSEVSVSDRVFQLESKTINFLQINKKDMTITLQKTEGDWQILEPVQDYADQNMVKNLINSISEEKAQNIESSTIAAKNEFGLDQPLATFLIKNNQGSSEKIQIGTQKNFEGQPFATMNDNQKVYVVSPNWLKMAEENLTYFREKRLYREDLSQVTRVRIKSLREEFVLEKRDQKWVLQKLPELNLDQNHVRKTIKEFAETTIQDYISEGDPSNTDLNKKGLLKSLTYIEFENNAGIWKTSVSMNEADHALYALTSKPTYLVKLDMSKWVNFANTTIDSLRDRKSPLTFALNEAHSLYFKIDGKIYEFVNQNQTWSYAQIPPEGTEFVPVQVEKLLSQVHDLLISEFLEPNVAKKFDGKNMIIIKSGSDQLVFQLNWGPLLKLKFNGIEKEVYLARTQLSKETFAIDKDIMDELVIDRVFKKIEPLKKAD